jgi:hypothetical protein
MNSYIAPRTRPNMGDNPVGANAFGTALSSLRDEAPSGLHPSGINRISQRLDGPARHIVIDPQPSWGGIAVMLIVAVLIGVMLAVGHA